MKKLFILALSLILVLCSASLCFADQVFFIDPSTGDFVTTDDAAGDAVSGLVKLTNDCNFDKTDKLYVYPTEALSAASVRSNIYDGMVTADEVYITADDGAMFSVYEDGTILSEEEYAVIDEPGVYIVWDDSCDSQLFRFTIVHNVTGQITKYDIPSIFYVASVTFNDADMTQVGNTVNLEQDGEYEIVYANDTVNQKYTLDLTIDHEAPQLLISGVNEKGVANSTVRFGEREENSSLVIVRDGDVIVQSDELKDAGDYVVTYSDEAGNEVVYTFTINFFLDAGGWIYVAMLAILVGACVFYYFRSKKKIRTC